MVADPDRQVGHLRPLWSYAHVPAGSPRDMTADVVAQIGRFAPGFRDVIVASRCIPAAQLARQRAPARAVGLEPAQATAQADDEQARDQQCEDEQADR